MKKIFMLLTIMMIACMLCGCGTTTETNALKSNDMKFNEVAHVCNDVGKLLNATITSPKIESVWYFKEEDNSGTDIVIYYTGSNTSSHYYQYFTRDGENSDFFYACYAMDELKDTKLILIGNGSWNEKIMCISLMKQAIENGEKFTDNQINELNELLSSGKIELYKKIDNKRNTEKKTNNVKDDLLGAWTLKMKTESEYNTSIISTYTFEQNGEFSLYNYMTLEDEKMMDLANENGKYSIDEKQSIIKLEFDNKETTLPKEIHYSYDNGTFIFNDSYSGENRYIKK